MSKQRIVPFSSTVTMSLFTASPKVKVDWQVETGENWYWSIASEISSDCITLLLRVLFYLNKANKDSAEFSQTDYIKQNLKTR